MTGVAIFLGCVVLLTGWVANRVVCSVGVHADNVHEPEPVVGVTELTISLFWALLMSVILIAGSVTYGAVYGGYRSAAALAAFAPFGIVLTISDARTWRLPHPVSAGGVIWVVVAVGLSTEASTRVDSWVLYGAIFSLLLAFFFLGRSPTLLTQGVSYVAAAVAVVAAIWLGWIPVSQIVAAGVIAFPILFLSLLGKGGGGDDLWMFAAAMVAISPSLSAWDTALRLSAFCGYVGVIGAGFHFVSGSSDKVRGFSKSAPFGPAMSLGGALTAATGDLLPWIPAMV